MLSCPEAVALVRRTAVLALAKAALSHHAGAALGVRLSPPATDLRSPHGVVTQQRSQSGRRRAASRRSRLGEHISDGVGPAADCRFATLRPMKQSQPTPTLPPFDEARSRFSETRPTSALDAREARLLMPQHPASRPTELAQWLVSCGVALVSARSLAELGVRSAKNALAAMRDVGLISASATRGVYFVRGASGAHVQVLGDPLLVAHLHAHPSSRVTWGPHMVPLHEGWTARPYTYQYALPKADRVSASFRHLSPNQLHRWEAKAPVLWYGLTPSWRYETELVYVAARPSRYSLLELHDYLWELAQASVLEYLVAELTGLPRAYWMKVCVLLRYGDRLDLADHLFDAAPSGGGPYYFIESRKQLLDMRAKHPSFRREGIWHDDLEVCDYLVDFYLQRRVQRYGSAIPEWAALSFIAGRPDGALPERYTSDMT